MVYDWELQSGITSGSITHGHILTEWPGLVSMKDN